MNKLIYIPKTELDKFYKLEKISSVYRKLSVEKIEKILSIIEEVETDNRLTL